MGFNEDLNAEVNKILQASWSSRNGTVVPVPKDVPYSNDAVRLDAVCLYADIADSTNLVTNLKDETAAEVFKCYLYCAAKTIHEKGGRVTAYDGDRVMAVYLGDSRYTQAVRTALAISHAVEEIIQPSLVRHYSTSFSSYKLRHGVGIAAGPLLVARAGFRTADDLVWIGGAANHAAKLSALRVDGKSLWITKPVFDMMSKEVRFSGDKDMWESRTWTQQGNMPVYCSGYRWPL